MKRIILILLTCILTSTAFAKYNVQTIAGQYNVIGNADGTNTQATFSDVGAIVSDSGGILYMADKYNRRIRKIRQDGTNWIVTTIAGNNTDAELDGLGTNACFGGPNDIAIDTQTNLYVVDCEGSIGNTVRKLSCQDGTNWIVTTIAGKAGIMSNKDGTGTNATFASPQGITADPYGHLYVADVYNGSIRQLTQVGTNWITATLTNGFPYISTVAVDTHTNIYFYYTGVAREPLHTIEKMSHGPTGWIVSTMGSVGGTADGTNSAAQFDVASHLAVDQQGNLFVTESSQHTLREVTFQGTNWIVTTVAGQPGIGGFQDGTTNALFDTLGGITIDPIGRAFISSGLFQGDCTLREAAPVPALSIRRDDTNAAVSWLNLGNYTLLTCTDMLKWTNCPQTVKQNGFTNTVIVPIQISTNIIPTTGSGTGGSGPPAPPGVGTNTNTTGNYQTAAQLFRLVSN